MGDEGGLARARVHAHAGLRALLVGDDQVDGVLPLVGLERLRARALQARLRDGLQEPGHAGDDDLHLHDLRHG